MRAACVQLCSGVDIESNLAASSELIREAAASGAAFIATPEMTHLLQRSSRELFSVIAGEAEDKGVAHFGNLARDLNVTLLIGSLAIKAGENRAVNRSYMFGRDGSLLAKYDKIHLFDVSVSKKDTWQESRIYARGDKAVTAQVGEANIGLSICYDLRFPHLYRAYAQQDVDIITAPAAFTRPTGKAHWETLLRARAIETGAFIIAPAQGGVHEDGRETWGRSMIVGPWGDIRASLCHDEPGILIADIDLEDVKAARAKIPAWTHDPDFGI